MPTTELNVDTAFKNVMRMSVSDYGSLPTAGAGSGVSGAIASLNAGIAYANLTTQLAQLSSSIARADAKTIFSGSSVLVAANNAAALTIGHMGDSTTSVATLAYEFFTGKTPTSGGYDYLVAPAGGNANNLNSTYYAQFNMENRFINFTSNLGKVGAGAASFQAAYGSLSLFDATAKAYATIFGVTPTSDKVHALIDTRTDYFASYGQDGANGVGTKAAMVGWLLAEAVKADTGTYATDNDSFLVALASGTAVYNTDLLATYGHAPVGMVGQAEVVGHGGL